MARALAVFEAKDTDGDVLPSASIRLYEADGSTPIAVSLYAAGSGGVALTQPLTPNSFGVLYVYSDTAVRGTARVNGGAAAVFQFDADPATGSGFVTLTGTETLTNKTITAPVIYRPRFREGQWFSPEAFPLNGSSGALYQGSYKPVPNTYWAANFGDLTLYNQELAWPDASLAVNAAIVAAKEYGGKVLFGSGGYFMDTPVNMSGVTQIEVSGVGGVTSSLPDVYGTHIIFRNTADTRNEIWWDMVGATYCHLHHMNIHQHFYRWDWTQPNTTDTCKAGIFIAGSYNPVSTLGLESANNVLEGLIMSIPATVGSVVMHGTSLNRMVKCQVYNISDGLGALVLSTANGGPPNYNRLQTEHATATFQTNPGNAEIPQFVAEHCEFHAFHQSYRQVSGHDASCVSVYIDGAQDALFNKCDGVSSFYGVLINDEQPGTRMAKQLTFRDCYWHGTSAGMYAAYRISSASTTKDLVIDGLRADPLTAVVNTDGNVSFDGLKIRRVTSPTGAVLAVPMLLQGGTDTATRHSNGEIDFGSLNATLDGSVDASNRWITPGTITKTNAGSTHAPIRYDSNGTLTVDSISVRTGITTKTPVSAAASGALTLTDSVYADVTGCSVSLAVGKWLVTGSFDMIEIGAGDVGIVLQGKLVTTGGTASIALSTATAIFLATAQNGRATVSQTWIVTVTAATTAKLQAQKVGGTGTSTAGVTHTTISASYVSAG